MKYFLVGTVALAAGISLATTSAATSVIPYEKLTLEGGTAFSATAGAQLVNATITPENPTVEGGYYMLEGELSDQNAALTMAANNDVTQTTIEQFTLTFKAGFVEPEGLPEYEGAKIGFALTSATTAQYFNGTDWVEFNEFTEIITEEAEVVLTVDFDGRQNMARFTLDEEVLKVGDPGSESDWVSVGGIVSNTIKAFGSGAVKSLAGLTKTIASAKIDDAGGVVIAGGDVSAFEKAADGTPIETFLETDAKTAIKGFDDDTDVTVADAYAIGLIVKSGDTLAPNADGGKLIVKKVTNVEPDLMKIPLALNTTVPEGNKVQYQLMGRNESEEKWTEIGELVDDAAKLSIPVGNNMKKYYKVEATVIHANANENNN